MEFTFGVKNCLSVKRLWLCICLFQFQNCTVKFHININKFNSINDTEILDQLRQSFSVVDLLLHFSYTSDIFSIFLTSLWSHCLQMYAHKLLPSRDSSWDLELLGIITIKEFIFLISFMLCLTIFSLAFCNCLFHTIIFFQNSFHFFFLSVFYFLNSFLCLLIFLVFFHTILFSPF